MKYFILFLSILAISFSLKAQEDTGGKETIYYGHLSWRAVKTLNFEILYYGNNEPLAKQTGILAEKSLEELEEFLDYKPQTRFRIYLYSNPYDALFSRVQPKNLVDIKTSGISLIRHNEAYISYPGTSIEHITVVKTEIARLILWDMMHEGTFQNTVQNEILLYLPEWYVEGLVRYLGEGWNYIDDSKLKTANINSSIFTDSKALTNNKVVVYKSIWYYIIKTYGEEKISSILNITRLNRSLNSGFLAVIGKDPETLGKNWSDFARNFSKSEQGKRESVEKAGQRIYAIGSGNHLAGSALHPNGRTLAWTEVEHGNIKLKTNDIQNSIDKSKVLFTGGKLTEQSEPSFYHLPMKWDKEGKVLAATSVRNGKLILLLYNFEDGKVKEIKTKPALDYINNFAWSNENQLLIISGSKDGQCDLYQYTGNSFRQLTNDIFDDINPCFSLDDKTLFFASNRVLNTSKKINNIIPEQNFDIFSIDFPDLKDSLVQITSTKLINEYPEDVFNSFELSYLSDQSGILNLWKRNIFTGDSICLSNFSEGINESYLCGSTLFIKSYFNGIDYPITIPNYKFTIARDYTETQLRKDILNKFTEELRLKEKQENLNIALEEQQIRRDSINKIVESGNISEIQNADTLISSSKKLRYYVFDEEEDQHIQNNEKNKKDEGFRIFRVNPDKSSKVDVTEGTFFKAFDPTSIKFEQVNGIRKQWMPQMAGMTIGFDPYFRLKASFTISLNDIRKIHELKASFSPYIDLKSNDLFLKYQNNKLKIHPSIYFESKSNFFNKDGIMARYNSISTRVGLGYVLSRFLNASAEGGLLFLKRTDLDLERSDLRNAEDQMALLKFQVKYDDSRSSGQFILNGNQASINVIHAVPFGVNASGFTNFRINYSRYQPVLKHSIFAIQVNSGFSIGNGKPEYFLGGVNDWVNSKYNNRSDIPVFENLNSFYFLNYVPVRGFPYNARNGTQVVSLTSELRVPVMKYFVKYLNTGQMYNFQLVGFYDIGTVWRTGNPLSQKNPIETQIIDKNPFLISLQTLKSPFLMSVGTGIRLTLLSYVTRFDLAWGIEDGQVLKPQFSISLGNNF